MIQSRSPLLLSPADCPLFAGKGSSTDNSLTALMDTGDCEMGAGDKGPSEVDFSVGTDDGLAGTVYDQMSTEEGPEDGPVDAGAGGPLLPERLVLGRAVTDGAGCGYSLSWALAMFGEDCFNEDVIQYAENLGQHTSACLEEKMQVGEAVQ